MRPRWWWFLPILAATRLALMANPWASEDAYITFRYAAQLASGNGLVYNLGDRVMGFTSLPWALWLALAFPLHLEPIILARITSLACDSVTLWVAFRMLSRIEAGCIRPRAAVAFACFFAGWPLFAASSASGLETSAFLCVLLAAGEFRSGWLLGLLATFRPEGMVAAAIIAWSCRPRERLIGLAILASYVGAMLAYYGSPIPHSLIAKTQSYGISGPLDGRQWWEWMLPLVGRFPQTSEGKALLGGACVIGPAFVVGLWRLRASLPAMLAGVAIWAGYSLGAPYFWWYMVTPVASVGAVAACGLPPSRGILAALALWVAGSWFMAPSLYLGRSADETKSFTPIAAYLREHATPNESVMAEPVGMIGYATGLKVIDEVGLVSPFVSARRQIGPGWYGDVVRSDRPDWIVVRKTVLQGAAFAGRTAPFISEADRARAFSGYRMAADVGEFAVLHR